MTVTQPPSWARKFCIETMTVAPTRGPKMVPGPPMSAIIVCPLSHVPDVAASRRPSHLITLLGPDVQVPTPHPVEAGRHLRITVNDIADPQDGLIHPCADHLQTILRFGEGWDGRDPLRPYPDLAA